MRSAIKLHIGHHSYINFIPVGKYAKAVNYKATGKDKICADLCGGGGG